jgi:hypothetical protein
MKDSEAKISASPFSCLSKISLVAQEKRVIRKREIII